VTATESVEITKEGRMVGDIAAPRVIIVDGASFRGRIDMGEVDVEGGSERTTRAAATPARTTLRPALSRPAPARPVEPKKAAEEKVTQLPAKLPVPPAPVAMGAVRRKVIVKRK
jgi:hypothetical protein